MNLKNLLFIVILICSFISCSAPKRVYQKPTYETLDANIKVKTKFDTQSFLESTDSTVDDMKKHVSVDIDCPIDKITVLQLSEQKGNAIYILDVCGTKMKYRRIGSVFYKDGEDPLSKQKKSSNSN